MNDYFAHRATYFAQLFFLLIGFASTSYSEATKEPLTANQRQTIVERSKKMADMHSQMARCLEAGKELSVCRQALMDSCSNNFGTSCPMGLGKYSGGKMNGPGMGMMNGRCMDWMMFPENKRVK